MGFRFVGIAILLSLAIISSGFSREIEFSGRPEAIAREETFAIVFAGDLRLLIFAGESVCISDATEAKIWN